MQDGSLALRASALLELRRRHGGTWQPGQGAGPAEPLDLLTWTQRYRPQLKPDLPLDFAGHAFLQGLYGCTARRVVVYKASQLGASEYAVSYALHAADQRQATVLYLFPTEGHVSDFSSARIGPAIEASEYLAEVVIDARGGSGNGPGGGDGAAGNLAVRKRGADRVTLKRVRDRFLYLRGAQVSEKGMAPQLKSVDADVLVLDEVDEMDPRAPSIAVKRLGHSLLAEERWISTPTYPSRGIHAQWLESDQREWQVRCGACGTWQPLTIKQAVYAWDALGRPSRWHGQEAGRAWCACRKCGKPLDRLGPGEWVAGWPARETVGFHLTKLFSPRASLDAIIAALQTTDETKRREAYNQDLGEPYTPTGGQLTDVELDGLRREYLHGPLPGVPAVAGVDVGKVLHVVIRAAERDGSRRQLWAGESNWGDLGGLFRRFGVKRAVIDALPETTKAREFQALCPKGLVWLAYYVTQATGSKRAQPAVFDEGEGIVHLDRTRTLDATFARFYDGVATLPANARDVPDYYAHLKAPVRVLEDRAGGTQVATYVEASADHLAHAENYCCVAELARPAAAVSAGRVVSAAQMGL